MSVNVLEYNEFVGDINTLRNTNLPAAKTCYAAKAQVDGTNCGGALSLSTACKQANYGIRLTCDLQTRPWDCSSWAAIPSLNTVEGGIKVCDASGSEGTNQIRCGASCSWTVPAGVTTARFQVWGAGAGSHNMCCCGGGMWGGSGAYSSVILPVTPGDTYTVCAGCAYCCMMRDAGPTAGGGCSSYVTGPGLCNFCADGGESSPYCWLQRAQGRGATGYCVVMNAQTYYNKVDYKGTTYGWCMCGGGGLCWGNTCSGRDAIPFTTSCRTWYGCVTNPAKSCHFVIGAPGMFNSANFGGGLPVGGIEAYDGASNEYCLTLTHPPIVNLTCDACTWGICAGATCAGCYGKVQCGVFPYPSRGGRATYVGGGCDNCGGSYGAGGMVCIQWNKE